MSCARTTRSRRETTSLGHYRRWIIHHQDLHFLNIWLVWRYASFILKLNISQICVHHSFWLRLIICISLYLSCDTSIWIFPRIRQLLGIVPFLLLWALFQSSPQISQDRVRVREIVQLLQIHQHPIETWHVVILSILYLTIYLLALSVSNFIVFIQNQILVHSSRLVPRVLAIHVAPLWIWHAYRLILSCLYLYSLKSDALRSDVLLSTFICIFSCLGVLRNLKASTNLWIPSLFHMKAHVIYMMVMVGMKERENKDLPFYLHCLSWTSWIRVQFVSWSLGSCMWIHFLWRSDQLSHMPCWVTSKCSPSFQSAACFMCLSSSYLSPWIVVSSRNSRHRIRLNCRLCDSPLLHCWRLRYDSTWYHSRFYPLTLMTIDAHLLPSRPDYWHFA